MICRCKKKDGYTAYPEPTDEQPYARNYEYWVCAGCLMPTIQVFESITNMYAPRGATALLSTSGKANGVWLNTFATDRGRVITQRFSPYPRTVHMDTSRNILLEHWALLDAQVLALMGEQTSPEDRAAAKHKARAFSESIAILMNHFYSDADAVAREAVARYKAKLANIEHDTPGLAEHLWNPTALPANATASKTQSNKVSSSDSQVDFVLSDSQVEFIRRIKSDKSMSLDDLGKMFSLTIEQIRRV